MVDWFGSLNTLSQYWVLALAGFAAYMVALGAVAGHRQATGRARGGDFWGPDFPVGEGWILAVLVLWGAVGAAAWPLGVLVAALIVVRALSRAVWGVARRREERDRAAREARRRSLLSQARDWDRMAEDSEQTVDTALAARARAIELRGEAEALK